MPSRVVVVGPSCPWMCFNYLFGVQEAGMADFVEALSAIVSLWAIGIGLSAVRSLLSGGGQIE